MKDYYQILGVLDSVNQEGGKVPLGSLPSSTTRIPTRVMRSRLRRGLRSYFDYPITNGLGGGKNNRSKTMKRMAYGYHNMDNFRLRILATNPSRKVTVPHLLT